MLDVANAGDVLLVEQVDRISCLNTDDWETLKTIITSKSIKIVALDLPTSHQFLNTNTDEFTGRMFTVINAMLLDMLAAVARKDYEDRRKRQKQGVQAAKEQGKYRGRQTDKALHRKIEGLLQDGKSYSCIVDLLGCSRATIAKAKKHLT